MTTLFRLLTAVVILLLVFLALWLGPAQA